MSELQRQAGKHKPTPPLRSTLFTIHSGKTLAFGLPALSQLIASPVPTSQKNKGTTTVSVLVVAPTRELAIQTHDTLLELGEPFGIASVAVFGGVDKAPQVKTLKNANKDGKTTRIIVGTPGRLLDLVNDGACDLSRCVRLSTCSGWAVLIVIAN